MKAKVTITSRQTALFFKKNYGTFNAQSDCTGYKLKFKALLQVKSKTKSKLFQH